MKLVDTSAWVEYLRTSDTDLSNAVRDLLEAGEAAWCDIVAMELANTSSFHQLARLQKIQRLAWCVETNAAVWNLARKLVHSARRSGMTAPLPDYLVFASSKIHDLEIIHRHDSDFSRLETVYQSF